MVTLQFQQGKQELQHLLCLVAVAVAVDQDRVVDLVDLVAQELDSGITQYQQDRLTQLALAQDMLGLETLFLLVLDLLQVMQLLRHQLLMAVAEVVAVQEVLDSHQVQQVAQETLEVLATVFQ
jgi:hypothetical protein